MKKIFLLVSVVSILCSGCNNEVKDNSAENLEKVADSLFKKVMVGHDVGMAKDYALEKAIGRTQAAIDSINLLPLKTRNEAAGYKQQLDSLMKDLSYADFAMDKWMKEMNWEPGSIEVNERIKYLELEKIKVDKVSEAILTSLARADSLLKRKP